MRTEQEIKEQLKYFKTCMKKTKSENVMYNLGFVKALEYVLEESELKNVVE